MMGYLGISKYLECKIGALRNRDAQHVLSMQFHSHLVSHSLTKVATILVERMDKVDIIDTNGNSALKLICMSGSHIPIETRKDIIITLFEHGANLSSSFSNIDEFARYFNGDVSWVNEGILVAAFGEEAIRRYNRKRGMAGMFGRA